MSIDLNHDDLQPRKIDSNSMRASVENINDEKDVSYAFRWDYYENSGKKEKASKKKASTEGLIYAGIVSAAFLIFLAILAAVILK